MARLRPITPEEFRANPELVKKARAILESDTFELMLEALETIAPVNGVPKPGITQTDACISLGEQTGWAQYPRELLKLAIPPEVKQPLPQPKYEPEQEEES